jgi:hypothetical protein
MRDLFGKDTEFVVSLRSPMAVQLANDTEGVGMILVADSLTVAGDVVHLRVVRALVESGSGPRERDCNHLSPVVVPLTNVAGWVEIAKGAGSSHE